MLVSHSKRFIYTKTIKTASTSVEIYFERFCMPPGQWRPSVFRDEYVSDEGIIGYRGLHDRDRLRQCTWHDHMPAAAIRRKLGDDMWNGYFKFCVVRNPFDRAVSAFHFFLEMDRRGFQQLKLKQTDDHAARFGEWVRKYLIRKHVVDDRSCYTIRNRICMDYIIRYESLLDGLKHVCAELDVKFQRRRLKNFVSGFRPDDHPVASYYDDATRELVGRHYRFELDEFDYEFPV